MFTHTRPQLRLNNDGIAVWKPLFSAMCSDNFHGDKNYVTYAIAFSLGTILVFILENNTYRKY